MILLWKRPVPATWVTAVVWSALGAFDALAAFIVEISTPWPEFFMLEIFGRSLFFGAAAPHLVIIYLLTRAEVLAHFGMAWSAHRLLDGTGNTGEVGIAEAATDQLGTHR